MAAILKKISDGRRHVHDFLKKSYFIFYKYHQGLVFCKHPNLYRRLILEEEKIKKKKSFFSFFEGGPDFRGGARGSPLKIGNPKMGLKGVKYIQTKSQEVSKSQSQYKQSSISCLQGGFHN